MKSYQKQIGDGKLPNKYFVFHYDQKYKIIDNGEFKERVLINENEDTEAKDSFIGEFKTYKEALNAVDNKAYLPNVVIEDRLSGQIFESYVIVCECCGKEDYYSDHDTKYTQEEMERRGVEFI